MQGEEPVEQRGERVAVICGDQDGEYDHDGENFQKPGQPVFRREAGGDQAAENQSEEQDGGARLTVHGGHRQGAGISRSAAIRLTPRRSSLPVPRIGSAATLTNWFFAGMKRFGSPPAASLSSTAGRSASSMV